MIIFWRISEAFYFLFLEHLITYLSFVTHLESIIEKIGSKFVIQYKNKRSSIFKKNFWFQLYSRAIFIILNFLK